MTREGDKVNTGWFDDLSFNRHPLNYKLFSLPRSTASATKPTHKAI
jgi:hypothetical protein